MFDFRNPFSTFKTNKLNGYDVFIMQSNENINKIIDDLEKVYNKGGHIPNRFEELLRYYELDVDDFTEPDLRKLRDLWFSLVDKF